MQGVRIPTGGIVRCRGAGPLPVCRLRGDEFLDGGQAAADVVQALFDAVDAGEDFPLGGLTDARGGASCLEDADQVVVGPVEGAGDRRERRVLDAAAVGAVLDPAQCRHRYPGGVGERLLTDPLLSHACVDRVGDRGPVLVGARAASGVHGNVVCHTAKIMVRCTSDPDLRRDAGNYPAAVYTGWKALGERSVSGALWELSGARRDAGNIRT